MRIRQFPQTMTTDYVQGIWKHLQAAIQEIQRKNNSGLSFEELYRNAYTMVLHKHGDMLYNGTRDQVRNHLMNAVRPTIVAATSTENTLQVILNAWCDHRTSMTMIRDILMYMDRVHVQANDIDNVDTMGVKLFREQIMFYQVISEKVKELLLKRVDDDRRGINSHLHSFNVKEVCSMLIALGVSSKDVYEKIFECDFLKKTEEFYREEAQSAIKSSSASDYVKKVVKRLEEEDTRTRQFLDPVSCPAVKHVLIKVMVNNCANEIVNMQGSGVVNLIENDRIDDLKIMHNLLLADNTDESKAILIKAVEDKLLVEGLEIVEKNLKEPSTYIENLVRLKCRYDWIIERAFTAEKKEYKSAQTKTFEKFMNDKSARSAEYLVHYIDTNFRKSSQNQRVRINKDGRGHALEDTNQPEAVASLLDSQGDEELFKEQCIVLFRLLQEKDCFEQFYKDSLANRMLQDKVSNLDLEQSMIGKLRTECGTTFTTKLEQMLKDSKNYKLMNEEYKNNRQTATTKIKLDINCKVLTQGTWPPFLTRDLVVKTGQNTSSYNDKDHLNYFPHVMQSAWEDYRRFYLGRHQGRRLNLLPSHGTCDIKFHHTTPSTLRKPRNYFIQTYPSFAIILCRFNEKSIWKYSDLLEKIPNYDHTKFKVRMSCLINGRYKILTKVEQGSSSSMSTVDKNDLDDDVAMGKITPRSATLSDDDYITINESFSSKMVKFQIMPRFKSKESADSANRQEAQIKIDKDRRHEIEAAIVRIMKARKTFSHNLLVTEVIAQLTRRFRPEMSVIKQKIEGLIEREYIRRAEGQRDMYEYVA